MPDLPTLNDDGCTVYECKMFSSAHAKGYNISNGIEAGMKILCEYTDRQKQESQKLKLNDRNPIGILNRGRIIVLTHLESQEHLESILDTFKSQV